MQKKLSIIFITSILFFGCASNNSGGIQAGINGGVDATDATISGLQQQQDTSLGDAQAIADTGSDIADTSNNIANTSQELANSIDSIVNQLTSGEGNSSEFADIIRRIQARGSIDCIDTGESNTNPD